MNAAPTDEDLMDRVQQGDAAAYQALFERHQGRVYCFLVRRTRNPEVASDLFQETFLSVHRARHTWRRGSRFRSWLFGIAANAVRDHFRRVRREPIRVELDTIAVYPKVNAQVLALEQAIASLPDSLREAFLLGAVEGLDHNEVAEALGTTPDAARARISRARAKLRSILEGES